MQQEARRLRSERGQVENQEGMTEIARFIEINGSFADKNSPEFTCRAPDQWAFEHGVELRLIQQVSQRRTDLLRVLTDAFAMSVRMNTGSGIFFMPEKRLMTGGRIITSVGHIRHELLDAIRACSTVAKWKM